jgi:deazaflavin-dependent oxidoreductase (nitroreductase family)
MANAKDLLFRGVTSVHRGLYRVSGGRVAGRGMGMPVLVLTTVGRKSGRKRQTMLTSPLQRGDEIVLVASFGGDDRNPAWYLNLRDNPEVEVEMDGRSRPMSARVATPDEKSELWPLIVADHSNYEGYQKKTDREIPVVILSPLAPESSPQRP